MYQFTTNQIRNVVLLSHSGAGKTSLVETMLFATKAINRHGRIEDGNTVSDFEPEEHRRQTSLQLSVLPCVWKGHKINLLDTPGYADFVGDAASALRVADAAVIVVSAPAGIEVGAEQAWARARALGLPTIVFINKMDREHADYAGTMAQIRSRLGNQCVALNLPVGAEKSFSAVLDLLAGSAPAELEAAAASALEQLTEVVAETSDELTERYLEGTELSQDDLLDGLRAGVRAGQVVPVLAGSATTPAGVEELMEAIVAYLPAPDDASAAEAIKGGGTVSLAADPNGPPAALIFKTSADPFVGKLSYFRVYSGKIIPSQEMWDANRGESERIGQVAVPFGKSQETVPEVVAGDIGCVSKLGHAVTGDTLTSRTDDLKLKGVDFPASMYSVAIHPKSQADLDKLSTALARLTEEDPTLRLSRDPATAEIIIRAMGDVHVDVMAEKAKRKFGVDLELAPPKIAYQETISKVTKVEYRHKKQTGGHGQYGHVWLRLEPRARGAGFEFASEVVGGNVPREYIPAVEKGVTRAMDEGAMAGYPIVDTRVVLIDGSSHSVDSSGASFEIAGSMALKKGVTEATPTLLEPIMRVTITVPEQFAGAVVGDLNSHRARIGGVSPNGEVAVIEAEVPQTEVQQYATSLRALTQGRGELSMAFDHYGDVPAQVAQRIAEGYHKVAAKV